VTFLRILNLLVIAVLVSAAAYVYKIKFDSTLEAERLAKLQLEIRRERDATAALRAEWSRLDNPTRIQALAGRHLALKAPDARQLVGLDNLPPRPPSLVPPGSDDPIGSIIEYIEEQEVPTGSIGASLRRP